MLEGYLQNSLQLSPKKFLSFHSVHNPYRTVASYFYHCQRRWSKKVQITKCQKNNCDQSMDRYVPLHDRHKDTKQKMFSHGLFNISYLFESKHLSKLQSHQSQLLVSRSH